MDTTLTLNTMAYQRMAGSRQTAGRLFTKAYLSGKLSRMGSLASLEQARQGAETSSGHEGGRRTVALDQVQGSEGRTTDFDARFRPLNTHTRQRWISVASANLDGALLPPVELVQYAGRYYVRDGHHRISAAMALGQDSIEAHVIVLG